MNIVIGGLLILWGCLVLYSSIFRMNKEAFENDAPIGATGYIEWEFLFKHFNKFPYNLIKTIVILIGTSIIALGTWVI
ncbi:hypothetical protein [Pseudalkalibacillus berkeleyi]|uniref:Uncharacterized protein n=1 Tax=Pseudalkalibacillus berkeleyi TaxID=1069813 RepID=A0ABS9H1P5_9BACL|nr:hypothetical protein [Pseudalkalibacillus berkeleyi]MCF6137750.1 hypothetical protein [Pseudalkalibacillus berkeleyi]